MNINLDIDIINSGGFFNGIIYFVINNKLFFYNKYVKNNLDYTIKTIDKELNLNKEQLKLLIDNKKLIVKNMDLKIKAVDDSIDFYIESENISIFFSSIFYPSFSNCEKIYFNDSHFKTFDEAIIAAEKLFNIKIDEKIKEQFFANVILNKMSN